MAKIGIVSDKVFTWDSLLQESENNNTIINKGKDLYFIKVKNRQQK